MRPLSAACSLLLACSAPDWSELVEPRGSSMAEACGVSAGLYALDGLLVQGSQACAAGRSWYWEISEEPHLMVSEETRAQCSASMDYAACAFSFYVGCPGAESWFSVNAYSQVGSVTTSDYAGGVCRYEARLEALE